VWTSASDNGNGNQTIWQDPTGETYVSSLIGASVSTLFP
jgi:hypothetical protein